MNTELIKILNDELGITLPDKISFSELQKTIADHINELITSDFHRLVNILYRVDVDEKKLTSLLETNTNETAGELIAGLVIERQLAKIQTRKKFRQPPQENDENERW